jgi:hypothetical protein
MRGVPTEISGVKSGPTGRPAGDGRSKAEPILVNMASVAADAPAAAASPRLRIGFVSTASIATKNLAAIRAASDRCVFAAVASRSLAKAQQWAAKHECDASVKVYGSYAELINDADIDALYIPLPTALHLDVVLQAVRLVGISYSEFAH